MKRFIKRAYDKKMEAKSNFVNKNSHLPIKSGILERYQE